MSRRDPRGGKGPKHVRLNEWFQALPAWTTLKPGPRALYIELKRRYNGGNNGNIRMAMREAAELLNVHRNTVPGYFEELAARGLIRETRHGYLGADGHGIASTWALCEMSTADGRPPDLSFRSWAEPQKSGTDTVHPRPNGRAAPVCGPQSHSRRA